MPKYHWFAFYGRRRKGRGLKLNHLSPDGAAFAEIQAALHKLGYEYGDLVPNRPPSLVDLLAHGGNPPLHVVDESLFRRGDLIVVPQRAPIDPDKRNRVERGFNTLEEKILEIPRVFFDQLTRLHWRLWPEYAAQLREPYRNRADLWFKANGVHAWYHKCSCLNGTGAHEFNTRKERHTAAAVLHVPEVPSLHGAGVLFFFGPGGEETLAWARRLRTDHLDLLREPGFTLVEMTPSEARPERAFNIRFFDAWTIDIVLQARARVPVRRTLRSGPASAAPRLASSS
jgi:hypothetical protein